MMNRDRYEGIGGFDSPWKLRRDVEAAIWLLDNAKGIRKETFDRFPDFRRRAVSMQRRQSDRILDLKDDLKRARHEEPVWDDEISELEKELSYTRKISNHLIETMCMIPEPHEL